MRKLFLIWLLIFLLPALLIADYDKGGNVKIGSDLTIDEGEKTDHAVCIGGDIMIYGKVEDEVVAIGGSIYLGPNAIINSDVVSIGGNIEKHDRAIVRGDIVELNSMDIEDIVPIFSHGQLWNFWWFGKLIFGLGYIALCIIIVLIFPETIKEVTTTVQNTPMASAGAALIGFISIIPLIIILAISMIGIPLIPLVGMIIMTGTLFGYTAIGGFIGIRISESLNKPETSQLGQVFFGILLLWILGLIPVMGGLIQVVANFMGFGACIMAIINRRKNFKPVTS